MSISSYTGLPGHGKSYGVVQNVIIPALKKGRIVFTNIPMNDDLCIKDFGLSVTPFEVDDIVKNSDWFTEVFIPGSLFVVDELWRLWPQGLKANQVSEQHKSFLAEHRHMVGENGLSTEIILVTQDLSQVAPFARQLVENTFIVRKLSNLGFNKGYRVDVYYGGVTGTNPPKSKRERDFYGKFNKKIWQYYKSHTKSETGEAGDESKIDGRSSKLFTPVMIFVTGFALVLLIYFLLNYGSLFSFTDEKLPTERVPLDIQKDAKLARMEAIQARQLELEIKKQKKADDFLTSFNSIEVVFNLGVYPKIDYIFGMFFEGDKVDVSKSDLQKLGYTVKAINNCLAIIKNENVERIARCVPENSEKQGFVTQLVSN